MTNHTEIDSDNPLRSLVQISALYAGVLRFARLVATSAKASGSINDEELLRIQQICLFELRNAQVTGLPIQDEALALTQALSQLEEILSSIR